MDDNPIECSEVRVRCPEVVVLQRPQLGVRRFLEAAWPLDIHASSDGNLGATRTRLYQDEAQRRDALRAAPSYADHLRSLAIETKVRLASAEEQARLFELAQRTNQFQTAADRPSMHAVADSVSAGRLLVVTVADRFGDYGISGGAFFHLAGDVLTADRIMLSCRVLGRGVEENLFDALVDIARERGCNHLDIALTPTLRNVPARRFLEGICGQLLGVPRTSAEGSVIWRFALDGLARCPRLDLLKHAVEEQAVDAVRGISSADWTLVAQMTGDSAALASELRLSPGLPYGSQAQTGEQGVLRVAANVLGRPVARNDNLYALGADSLKIVRLLARLKSVLGIDIPIGDVLYRADVAELLRLSQVGQSQSAATDDGFFDQTICQCHEPRGLRRHSNGAAAGRVAASGAVIRRTLEPPRADCADHRVPHA
jgi:acyl carrier protein